PRGSDIRMLWISFAVPFTLPLELDHAPPIGRTFVACTGPQLDQVRAPARGRSLAPAFRVEAEDLLEHRCNDLLEFRRVLRRRKMSPAEDHALRILDLLGRALGHLRRTGEVVFPGQEEDRHLARNLVALVAEIGIDAVEIEVTLED